MIPDKDSLLAEVKQDKEKLISIYEARNKEETDRATLERNMLV